MVPGGLVLGAAIAVFGPGMPVGGATAVPGVWECWLAILFRLFNFACLLTRLLRSRGS